MGELSPIHWLIVIAIIVILFGGKRIPEVMRGMGEGVRNFKEGMRGPETPGTPVVTQVVTPAPTVVAQAPPVAPVVVNPVVTTPEHKS
jgi:sec-independent protein translocase protein TatA